MSSANGSATLGTLSICRATGTPSLSDEQASRLVQLAQVVLATYPRAGEVQLILTDNASIRKLNAAYRGMDVPTDVLTFDLSTPPTPVESHVSGEIYISLECARQQARDQQVTLLEEVARLLTHGLLHLAGFGHDTPQDLHEMESETDRLLSSAGLVDFPKPH